MARSSSEKSARPPVLRRQSARQRQPRRFPGMYSNTPCTSERKKKKGDSKGGSNQREHTPGERKRIAVRSTYGHERLAEDFSGGAGEECGKKHDGDVEKEKNEQTRPV